MMKNIIENKKLLFGILAGFTAGLLVGFIFFAFLKPVDRRVEHPQIRVEHPQLREIRAGVELAKTYYQVGEKILVKPYLTNISEQPITVFGGKPILFAKIYDAENREVLRLPMGVQDILAPRTLKPQAPYYPYDVKEDILRGFTFTLDQPGRYKVVAWAEFSLDEGYAHPLRVYADPIQIWIGEQYYGSSTYGQCQRDNDCFISGCNAEVCQSRAEEPRVTICILPEKPTPKQLNYGCQCVNQMCQWLK